MIYARKWPEYAKQWDTMTIDANRISEAAKAAEYAVAHKDIYQRIQDVTGIPWPMVAVDHRRESDDQDKQGNPRFTTYLGNGQPLWIKTTIVPKGRGPFCKHDAVTTNAFVDGAIDAYRIDGIDDVKDWRLEKILYYCELFNGAGYAVRGLPSPYLWGGTNIQQNGKFVKDHVFRVTIRDKQLGVAPILYYITKLDNTVVYKREN